MVDEQYTNIDNSQRLQIIHNFSSSSSCCVDMEIMDYNNDQGNKSENGINHISNNNNYDASTSSPESTSEIAFNFSGCHSNGNKLNNSSTNEEKNGEKKVHWNPSQVHALLDCIEKRMSDFRRKSVHKSVWLAIGKEMSEQGEFSVEHCYNKWKNLRRDIRLFSSTNAMQKLSIRNTYIMERVQRMVNEIGYEGSSRKSSSPISPNFDMITSNSNENNTQLINNNNKEVFWSVYSSNNNNNNNNNLENQDNRLKKLENNLTNYQQITNKLEPNNNNINIKSEKSLQSIQIEQIPINNNNYHKSPTNNINNININTNSTNDTIGNSIIEDSIISLLSDPAVSQAIIMNPKLLEEILPGLDFTALMKKFTEAHPELLIGHIPTVNAVTTHSNNNQFPMNAGNVSIGVSMANNNNHNINNNNGTINHHNNINNKKKQSVITTTTATTNLNSVPHLLSHHQQQQHQQQNDMNNSWPHQLYELLHSFRDEESRQMARLDQIVGYVQVMQESTKRRLSTINQLISLAGLLIPQK